MNQYLVDTNIALFLMFDEDELNRKTCHRYVPPKPEGGNLCSRGASAHGYKDVCPAGFRLSPLLRI